MKAVIWTDVVQASIMFVGLILSIIFGMFYSKEIELKYSFENEKV